jgi:hypothetical protein
MGQKSHTKERDEVMESSRLICSTPPASGFVATGGYQITSIWHPMPLVGMVSAMM